VVLSACESGLGEIRSGEGVLGLRRGFAASGARHLVMSLWAIPDAETAALMDEFYRYLLHKRRPMPVADALHQAQLERLRRARAEGDSGVHSWAGFVATGVD